MNRRERKMIEVVIAGAPGSGKLTSLRSLIRRAPAERRGRLIPIKSDEDILLTIDLSTGVTDRDGRQIFLKLWTVNGEVRSSETWRTLLKRADGVFYLIDFCADNYPASVEMLEEVRATLSSLGRNLEAFPWVFGLTNCEKQNATQQKARIKVLNPTGLPCFDTVSTTGKGLFQGLKVLLDMVVARQTELDGVTDPLESVVSLQEHDDLEVEDMLPGFGSSDDGPDAVESFEVIDSDEVEESFAESVVTATAEVPELDEPEVLAVIPVESSVEEEPGELDEVSFQPSESTDGENDLLPGFVEVEPPSVARAVPDTPEEQEAASDEEIRSGETVTDIVSGESEKAEEPKAETPRVGDMPEKSKTRRVPNYSWSRPEFALSSFNRQSGVAATTREWEKPDVMIEGTVPPAAKIKPLSAEKTVKTDVAEDHAPADHPGSKTKPESSLLSGEKREMLFKFPDVQGPSSRGKQPEIGLSTDDDKAERGDTWRRLARNLRDKKY